jgi:hypothetical protein
MTSAVAVVMLVSVVAAARGGGESLFEAKAMVGVSGPYLGTANPIRGVAGGGAPWSLDAAKSELASDGRLEVSVTGLVLTNTGVNPVASFRAVLSCQTVDGMGNPAVVNLSTGDFPATSTGDAIIEQTLTLPPSCLAPIVFVTNPTGRWFAVTGF